MLSRTHANGGGRACTHTHKHTHTHTQETLRECKALDFSSFIGEAARLLRTHEAAKQRFCHLFSHVLVDEFQDTSKAQFNLVTCLAPHGGVTVGPQILKHEYWRYRVNIL